MLKKLKYILPVLALVATADFACAQSDPQPPVVLNAAADSATVTMGGRTNVHVELIKNSHNGAFIDKIKKDKGPNGQEILSIDNTEVRKVTVDSTDLGGGRIQVNYDYLVQPFDVGTANIGPFAYALNGDTTYSPMVSIKVLEPDMPQEMRDSLWINPMEGVVSIKARWYDVIPEWWPWLVGGLALAAILVVLFLLYRKNGKHILPRKKVEPPYDQAMRRLTVLKNRRLAESGHIKEYYTELTEIMRQYLNRRFGIYALEMTSPQILEACLAKPETAPFVEAFTELLTTADFVKFAKQNPGTDENVRSYAIVRNFVESTKPAPEEQAKKAPRKPQQRKPKNKSKRKAR